MPEVPLPDPPLRRGSVRLRPWALDDAPWIVATCRNASISRFSPVIPVPYTERDALEWLQSQEPMRLAGRAIDLAVVHADTDELLGTIGLGNVSWVLQSATVGYWLAAQARGHGYMTSAVRALAAWVFDELGFARVELTTDPDNVESQRVAERCGFRREGHLRSHMRILHSGERRDSLIYGLLAGELA